MGEIFEIFEFSWQPEAIFERIIELVANQTTNHPTTGCILREEKKTII